MNTLKKIFFLSSLLLLLTNSLYAEEHGEVSLINNQEVAWDKDSKTWLSMEAFWRNYANKSDGFIWKDSRTFPQYSKVKEFDLFMAINDEGICLMEFFHTRWRRANDVRRWDDKFNEYGACSTIFN